MEDYIEYVITKKDGNDFITEDKNEADEKFENLKLLDRLYEIEQYYKKVWVWDEEREDYVEDDVEVYYTK